MRVPISEISGGRGRVHIPELGITTSSRGDLAAFWAGYRAGRLGSPIPKNIPFDDTSIFRRAYKRGSDSRKELT